MTDGQAAPDAVTAQPAAPAVPDDELRELLATRDREDAQRARTIARGLTPGPCPVCGDALTHDCGFLFFRPFLRRGGLACQGCGFRAESAPNVAGWTLALLLAIAAAVAGATAVIKAQRLADPTARTAALAGGIMLLGGGLFAGWQAQGLGDTQGTANRIVRGWRRRRGEPDEPPPPSGWVSENLEAVVVAVILALIIRHFAMEAFVIPTGSMAPTLLGDHFEVTCPRCGNAFALSKSEDELTDVGDVQLVTGRCPLCDEVFDASFGSRDVFGGNKILVNKFVYKTRRPRRYEVVVFKFPEEPWKNYIKRLVGLPGDRLRIRNGDLWVDDRLARKPDEVQDAIWIPVHDGLHLPQDRPAPWQPVPRDGDELTPQPDVWNVGTGARIACGPRPGEPAWLEYTSAIYDRYGYTREGSSNHVNRVSDLRVTADVTAAAGATVRLAVVESVENERGLRVVAARVPVGDEGFYAIEVDGEVQSLPVIAPGLVPGRTHEVALSYADDRARIIVDGATVVTWDDPFAPDDVTAGAYVRLGAEGGPVTFERPRIDRDVHYVGAIGARYDPADEEVVVPEGCYFVMGDNSPNSQDGRNWGFVHEGHLIGRAFLVFWPVAPNQVKLIR